MAYKDKLPRKTLEEVCKVLVKDMNIPAEMSQHDRVPCIVLIIGKIVYFQSSGDFRMFIDICPRHWKVEGCQPHKTFRSSESLFKFLGENYEKYAHISSV